MTPEQYFNDSQIKLDLLSTEWKNFMKECLMKTEITRKKIDSTNSQNEICFTSNPSLVMDVRHQMIKNRDFSTAGSMPKESIQTQALKLLREEKIKKLSWRKEERIVANEIERLKKAFENYRAIKRKQLEDCVKEKTIKFATPNQKRFVSFSNRLESKDDLPKAEACPTDVRSVLLEVHNGGAKDEFKEREIPHVETISIDRKGSIASHEEENEFSLPNVRKWNQSQCDGKSVIMQKFFESRFEVEDWQRTREVVRFEKACETEEIHRMEADEEDSFADRANGEKLTDEGICSSRRSMENAWKSWRSFTLKSLQRKNEKIKYLQKIESFLTRLEEVNAKKLFRARENHQINIVRSDSSVEKNSKKFNRESDSSKEKKMQDKKAKASEKNGKKKEEVKKLGQEIRMSQRESYQRLILIEKRNNGSREKVKCLKNILNVFERGRTKTLKVHPAPEFLSRMEKRREERIARWRDIQEGKRKAEAEREKVRLEKEKEIREAEKLAAKKKREEIREREKLERETREKLKFQLKLAEGHHQKLLLLRGWTSWSRLMRTRQVQHREAQDFDGKRLQRMCLKEWKRRVEEIAEFKRELANLFYRRLLRRIHFGLWLEKCEERKIQFQAAADWNDFKIAEKFFKKWLSATMEEQLKYLDMKEMADSNFQRKLKAKSLRKLRDYRKIRKLELAMEKRKCFWRRKVQQILPDYRPVDASEISRD